MTEFRQESFVSDVQGEVLFMAYCSAFLLSQLWHLLKELVSKLLLLFLNTFTITHNRNDGRRTGASATTPKGTTSKKRGAEKPSATLQQPTSWWEWQRERSAGAPSAKRRNLRHGRGCRAVRLPAELDASRFWRERCPATISR